MRALFCGDRNWDDAFPIGVLIRGLRAAGKTIIIEGEARGADSLARRSAERQVVDYEPYPAKWEEHGKAAGPIRNQQMLDEGKPNVVFAFHDDIRSSKGTLDMCRRAFKAGIPVYIISRFKGRIDD